MKEGEIMSIDLIIFTDGSAQIGKPQYGGYSCIFVDPKKCSIIYWSSIIIFNILFIKNKNII